MLSWIEVYVKLLTFVNTNIQIFKDSLEKDEKENNLGKEGQTPIFYYKGCPSQKFVPIEIH